jgi:hypothetical protein
MKKEEFGVFQSLISDGMIFKPVQEIGGKIVLLSTSIFVVFYIIYVGYMYFKHHTFDLNTKKLIESLTNGLLILGGLTVYVPLSLAVVELSSIINSAFFMSNDELGKYFEFILNSGEPKGFTDKITELITDILTLGILETLEVIWIMLIQITRMCMLLYSITMANILYCFGPLAIVFSLLFPDKFQFWFTTFLNIIFIPLTVALLDRVLWALLQNVNDFTKTTGIEAFGSNFFLRYSFIILGTISYSMAPWLTSNFVGNKNAGVVLTVASQYAKQAATTIASKGLKAAGFSGSGNGGGGAAGSATQGGKDIIKGS